MGCRPVSACNLQYNFKHQIALHGHPGYYEVLSVAALGDLNRRPLVHVARPVSPPLGQCLLHPRKRRLDAHNLFGRVYILGQAVKQISDRLHQDDNDLAHYSQFGAGNRFTVGALCVSLDGLARLRPFGDAPLRGGLRFAINAPTQLEIVPNGDKRGKCGIASGEAERPLGPDRSAKPLTAEQVRRFRNIGGGKRRGIRKKWDCLLHASAQLFPIGGRASDRPSPAALPPGPPLTARALQSATTIAVAAVDVAGQGFRA